jgi:hypothetical protein
VSLFLLHWRIGNEPGASRVPGLRQAGLLLLAGGLSGTAVCTSALRGGCGAGFRVFVTAAGAALAVYCPLLALTLAMLV